jgi:hypothetical protein
LFLEHTECQLGICTATVLSRVVGIEKCLEHHRWLGCTSWKSGGRKSTKIAGTGLEKNINLLHVCAYSYVVLYLPSLPFPVGILICQLRIIESETSKQSGRRSASR